jgi:uncharacterized membrane protein YqiK
MDLLTILIPVGVFILFLVFLYTLLNSFLKKAAPGTALVKTGLGLQIPQISTSSAIAIPLIHRIETIELTVKTIKIVRRGMDSLSCADGIRAEIEVDFYIKINPVEDDIRRVATTVGCDRASNIQTMKELFEAKFADALKTAGSKMTFDQLYQNRHQFRDEILVALGHSQGGDVVLNGYRLDDVAIHYLEQLPLTKHDENNVFDSKGIKEIALRTSNEAESANKRLREKEVTIAEQNREARIKQLQIEQDLKEKESIQQREVQERFAKENALVEKTRQEQTGVEQQAFIAKERAVKIAEEMKLQEIKVVEIQKERAIMVAEEEKNQAVETAKIQKENAIASQLKEKLKILEENAKQESQKIKAEEQALTVKAMEVASRDKQIEVIKAEKNAQVELLEFNVETDKEAYKLKTLAQAKKDASELEYQAALQQAKTIMEIGNADAGALAAKLQVENSIGKNALLAQTLRQIIPLLPEIIEKLMLPAEKIDSIKFLHINGLQGQNGAGNESGVSSPMSPTGGIINTMFNVSMLLPIIKEIVKTIKSDSDVADVLGQIKQIPGGEKFLQYIEANDTEKSV